MGLWFFWLQTLVLAGQENPPRLVEILMLFLALVLLAFLFFFWQDPHQRPYLVLSLSYGIGASASLLVRETFSHPPRLRFTRVGAISAIALLLLTVGLWIVLQDTLLLQS